MPEFETYVDVEVDEFWNLCSRREKESLIDMLEEDGWVRRTIPKGTDPSETLLSIMEIEWQEMCNKLSELRLRISPEHEEMIKQIVDKYV
jgi:hypothetical protein